MIVQRIVSLTSTIDGASSSLTKGREVVFNFAQMNTPRYQMDLKGFLVIRGPMAQWIVVWVSDHTTIGLNPTARSNCYFRFSQKH